MKALPVLLATTMRSPPLRCVRASYLVSASKAAVAATVVLVVTGCLSTHTVPLRYESAREMVATTTVSGTVAVGSFRDDRGTDANWLGAIRAVYGNPLKKLRTEQPTREIVEEAFREALRVRGLLASVQEATFEIRGSIKKLDCSYYLNQEAHAHLKVELVRVSSDTVVFGSSYRSDQTAGGFGAGMFAAGMFASVETLRQLAQRTLNAAIEQFFDDASFSRALGTTLVAEPAKLGERLRRLDSLRESSVITEDEYQVQRRKILNEL